MKFDMVLKQMKFDTVLKEEGGDHQEQGSIRQTTEQSDSLDNNNNNNNNGNDFISIAVFLVRCAQLC